jgi:uncharacterized protein YbgA (DUF1722 family)
MGLDQAANFAPIRNLRNPILIKHLFGFLGPFLNLKHQKAVFPKVERTWPQGPIIIACALKRLLDWFPRFPTKVAWSFDIDFVMAYLPVTRHLR